MRFEGVSFFAESLLLVVDAVLIRLEDEVLMVPARSLMGVFCISVLFTDVLSVILGSNTREDPETFDWTRERRGKGLIGLLAISFSALFGSGSSSKVSTRELRRFRVRVTCLGGSNVLLGLYLGNDVPTLSRGRRTGPVSLDSLV